MRIIAGRFKGHSLASPSGRQTRPTSDRLRETIFNILAHGDYPLDGARVLDLFAGTGALGFEALSRGAIYALFVEEAAAARAALQQNIEMLGLTGMTKVFRRDATALGLHTPGAGGPFSLAFLDPPYGRDLAAPALRSLVTGNWLAPGAAILIECAASDDVQLPGGIAQQDRRVYGDTALILARLQEKRNA